MKKIVTDNTTIFVNHIKFIRIMEAGVSQTKEKRYTVTAVLEDCTDIDIDNINCIILNYDENGELQKTREEAQLFKDFLERKLDNQWETIFTLDVLKEVNDYINYSKQEHKSTMVDISKLKLNEKGEVVR